MTGRSEAGTKESVDCSWSYKASEGPADSEVELGGLVGA